MMSHPAYAAYRQMSVQTAGRDRLLLMVYDGLLHALEAARAAIHAGDAAESHLQLSKAQTIIREGLWGVLDPQYEISRSLAQLYEYCVRRLIEANVKKDAAIVEEVTHYMRGLRDAFAEAAVRAKQQAAVHTAEGSAVAWDGTGR